jgi:hypothetical protein
MEALKAEDVDVVSTEPGFEEIRIFVDISVAVGLGMTAEEFGALTAKQQAERVAPFVIDRIEIEPHTAIDRVR